MRRRLGYLVLLLTIGCSRGWAADFSLAQRPWVQVSTAHFHFYSCGPIGSVYLLAARLEQFSTAYAQLAGAQAVASPPISVMAFPDHPAMQPFLPLYDGQPANLSGFFQHGGEENMIVLSLPEPGASTIDLHVIFHEYTHFLFRHNDRLWPVWLKEGMAEVYSTFQISGRQAQIALPIEHHLRLLAAQPLMPLRELFAVKEDSPQYNERDRQGLLYAESWLLTHYLMTGGNPQHTARFGQFTTLLRQGQAPVAAFTNALGTSLPAMQAELRAYLARGVFRPLALPLSTNISAPIASQAQMLVPAETYFRLGDELLRIGRLDAADEFFQRGHQMAPKSPWLEQGLGLLAAQRHQSDEATRHLQTSIQLGSSSFLVFYAYAEEKYRASADAQNRHRRLDGPAAAEIRNALEQSIALMPDFAPARALLGFFEMVQGDNLEDAGQQLMCAIQLEPENHSYLISLAQLQLQTRNPEAARQTLQSLLHPNEEAEIRAQAQALLSQMGEPGQ